jgi:hypothetical protein
VGGGALINALTNNKIVIQSRKWLKLEKGD